MRRAVVLLLIGTLGAIGLTACMSDDEESASATTPRRSAALIAAGPEGGSWQLTIDGLTPSGQAIEVNSWSWGITNTSTMTTVGKVTVHDLNIVKTMDAMSPLLFGAVAQGKHYASATLTLTKGGEMPAEYARYVFDDVLIKGAELGGNNPDVPRENVTLAFRKVSQQFTPTTDTGKAGTPTQFSWDLATATKY